ncbi:MAG: hypothetical protein ABIO72_03440 [Patescibacteria group bacterium]
MRRPLLLARAAYVGYATASVSLQAPLYAHFLARLPPGSDRGRAWRDELLSFRRRPRRIVSHIFGDYDASALVHLIDESMPPAVVLQEAAAELGALPDHRCTLLVGRGYAREPERLLEAASAHPLFCCLELRVQSYLVAQSSTAIDRALACTTDFFEREQKDLRCFPFLSLGSADVVLMIFGNRLADFRRAAHGVRAIAQAALGNDFPFPLELRMDPAQSRHLFQSSYSILGLTQPPHDLGATTEALHGIATERDEALAVELFVSTFPGHEEHDRLHNTIRAALHRHQDVAGDVHVANGLFDLVIRLSPTGDQRWSSCDAIKCVLDLLHALNEELGPQSDHPTVMRTNTVWLSKSESRSISEHHTRQAVNGQRVTLRPAPSQQLAGLYGSLQSTLLAYAALARNGMYGADLLEIRGFLEILVDFVHLLPADCPSKEIDRVSEALMRAETALAVRTYAASHSLREDISSGFIAASLKLLRMYSGFVTSIQRQLPQEWRSTRTALLLTLGPRSACHTYASKPGRLVVVQVAPIHLLRPRAVATYLVHEVLHSFLPPGLLDSLVDALFETFALAVAEAALVAGVPVEPSLVRARLGNDLPPAADWLAAYERVKEAAKHFSYFLRLLAPGDGVVAPDYAAAYALPSEWTLELVRRLDAARETVLLHVRQSYRLFEEVVVDWLAGRLTNPRWYFDAVSELLTELDPSRRDALDQDRLQVLAAVDRLSDTPLPARLRPIVQALQSHPLTYSDSREEIFDRGICLLDNSPISSLDTHLSEESLMQLSMYLTAADGGAT